MNAVRALESNTIFRAVIVAMFSIIMAISGIGATYFISTITSVETKVGNLCQNVVVLQDRLGIVPHNC